MVIGIILSLALLTFIAYRGYSVILFAPFCALLAALTAGSFQTLLPVYTEIFMAKAVGFIKSYFPVFLFGAVFGKIMEETGLARDIALWIIKKVGPKGSILSVMIAGGILAYGGVSVFVAAFALYPLAAAMFKAADIPKRLIPGTIAAGIFTFAMTALPGTPQIQNLIPTKYYGTTAFEAPILGIIGAIIMFVGSWLWLEYRAKKAKAAGEGYGTGHINEPTGDIFAVESHRPILVSLAPLLTVLILNYVLTKAIEKWPAELVKPYGLANVTGSAAIWALIVAVVLGCVVGLLIGWKEIKGEAKIQKALNAGAIGSLLAIMNTASETGYGGVIASLPGYKQIAAFITSIDPGTPLLSEAIAVNVMAGLAGSASGGLGIALEMMGKQYLEWANRIGMDPGLLHKVASMASGGLDSLPHNGAVITLLGICGLTHRQSYADIGMCTVIIPIIATGVVIILGSIFGSF